MKFLLKNKVFLIFSLIILSVFAFGKVKAGSEHNFSHWAWSSNIGWISFNNITAGGGTNYGVHVCADDIDPICPDVPIPKKNKLTGYAWSENIGWITFKSSELVGCPSGTCEASLDIGGTEQMSGWARALSYGDGWEGWISLKGIAQDSTPYGVYRNPIDNELYGWAWGGNPTDSFSEGVIGWISFNCDNPESACSNNYYVKLFGGDLNPPTVSVKGAPAAWQQAEACASIECIDPEGGECPPADFRFRVYDYDIGSCPTDYSSYSPPEPGGLCGPFQYKISNHRWVCAAALDSAGNPGFSNSFSNPPAPVEFLVDRAEPSSQIDLPPSNEWFSNDFNLDTYDQDFESQLDGTSCQFKVLSYDLSIPACGGIPGPACEYSTAWASRTCNSPPNFPVKTITVGPGEMCGYEGRQTCWVHVRARDLVGNTHSPTEAKGSIKYYNIDWSEPEVGKLYITDTPAEQTYPIQVLEGASYDLKSHVTDNVKVAGCDLYIDNVPWGSMDTNPRGCDDDCTASSTQSLPVGTYNNNYVICIDAMGNTSTSEKVVIEVMQNFDPQITEGPMASTTPSQPEGKFPGFDYCEVPTTQPGCLVYFGVAAQDNDGDPLTYTWSFGDGNVGNGPYVFHQYLAPNPSYTATVTIDDGRGGIDIGTVNVEVTNPTLFVDLCAGLDAGVSCYEDSVIFDKPANDADLKATVSGTMYGTIDYYFDCNIGDGDCAGDRTCSGSCVGGADECQTLSETTEEYTAFDLCDYPPSTGDGASYIRSNGSTGISTTLDIGSPDTDRLVVVFLGNEGGEQPATQVTVDGKNCNLAAKAHNTVGAENHQEMWYCDEDDLGFSSGLVTVAFSGGDGGWAIHAHLYTGIGQSGPTDFGIDQTSAGINTVTVSGINVSSGGLVVMGAGEGSGGLTVNNWTSPQTERTNGPDPGSADLITASGIELSAQTDKSYIATFSGAFNRGTGIVATWPKTGAAGIAIDSSPSVGIATGQSIIIPHTVDVLGTNRLMLVGVSIDPRNDEFVNSVTWKGTESLTLVGTAVWSDDARIEIWKLVAPPTGPGNIEVIFSADLNRAAIIGVMSFTGVNQNEPLGAYNGFAWEDIQFPSIDIPSEERDLIFAVVSVEDQTISGVGAGQTEHWNVTTIVETNDVTGGGSIKPGGPGNTTMSWSFNGGDHTAMGGVAIKPALFYTAKVLVDRGSGTETPKEDIVNITLLENDPPVLSWAGEENYETDGLHPEDGDSTTNFTYKVAYCDLDGDAPDSVKVHIKKGGVDIAGSPFVMNEAYFVGGGSGDYTCGNCGGGAGGNVPCPLLGYSQCIPACGCIWIPEEPPMPPPIPVLGPNVAYAAPLGMCGPLFGLSCSSLDSSTCSTCGCSLTGGGGAVYEYTTDFSLPFGLDYTYEFVAQDINGLNANPLSGTGPNVNNPPTAMMDCQVPTFGECGGQGCLCTADATPWITYNQNTTFNITNNSDALPDEPEDYIAHSEWGIYYKNSGNQYGVTTTCTINPVCDITLPSGMYPSLSAGPYYIVLMARDTGGLTDFDRHEFYVRQEATADFLCSLTGNLGSWQDCNLLTVSEGEQVYLRDNLDPLFYSNYSEESEGALSILSRTWKLNSLIFSQDNDPVPTITLGAGTNVVELIITDDMQRTSVPTEHSITVTLPLPEWKEVPPP